MLGLLGTMQKEIELFVSHADIGRTASYAGTDFYQGTLDGADIVIGRCGVGKVNAAATTQIMIDRFNVDSIILGGLAGSMVPYLQQGDLVLANHLAQYDVDLTVFDHCPGELRAMGRLIETDPAMLKAMTEAYDVVYGERPDRPQMVVGTIISGDRLIADKKAIARLQREFGAVAAEMEGAAVAQVCQLNTVPFLVVRTISDDASADAQSQFVLSLEAAPICAFTLIRQFLSAGRLQPV